MTNYAEILNSLYPNVKFSCMGAATSYENISWVSGEEIPSQEALDAGVLGVAKEKLKQRVNVYRDEWLYDYFTYDGKQWDCDEVSRNNISGLNLISVLNGGNLPPGLTFRDFNNNDWPVDAAYMANMAGALLTFTNTTYIASWTHKAAIDGLGTITAVNSYDITQGWPAK